MNYVLETVSLTKAYRRHLAVDRVDMHVAEGTIYGLLVRTARENQRL